MTELQLEELVNELNINPESSKFILSQISSDIYFGKVWNHLPWENQIEYQGDKFYFINRIDHGFVGAIEVTSSEMHAYLKPAFRGKGIMCNTLREIILPHAFRYNKTDVLRITIDQNFHGEQFRQIEHSALLAGFKDKHTIVDQLYEYYAYKKEYPEFSYTEELSKSISEKELNFIHDRVNSINAQLQYMKERYEILFNEEDKLIGLLIKSLEQFEQLYDEKVRGSL